MKKLLLISALLVGANIWAGASQAFIKTPIKTPAHLAKTLETVKNNVSYRNSASTAAFVAELDDLIQKTKSSASKEIGPDLKAPLSKLAHDAYETYPALRRTKIGYFFPVDGTYKEITVAAALEKMAEGLDPFYNNTPFIRNGLNVPVTVSYELRDKSGRGARLEVPAQSIVGLVDEAENLPDVTVNGKKWKYNLSNGKLPLVAPLILEIIPEFGGPYFSLTTVGSEAADPVTYIQQ